MNTDQTNALTAILRDQIAQAQTLSQQAARQNNLERAAYHNGQTDALTEVLQWLTLAGVSSPEGVSSPATPQEG